MCARMEMKTLTTMESKRSTKYKREAKRRTEANVAVCAATEWESANIFFSFFMRKVIHVTATWKIEELKKTTLALASTFYASAHIYGACICAL